MIKISKFDKFQSERTLINFNFSFTHRKELLLEIEKDQELFIALNEALPILLNKNCGLTTTQITKIASSINGKLNIKAYAKYYPKLKAMGFSFLHMIKITDCFDAYEIFPLIVNSMQMIKRDKLSVNDIVKMFELIESLDQFLSYRTYLKQLFELQISRVNIRFLIKNHLIEGFIFYLDQISEKNISNEILDSYIQERVSIKHLELYFKYSGNLKDIQLSPPCIYRLASYPNSIELMRCALAQFPKLIENGFKPKKLLEILTAEKGQENLEILAKMAKKLLAYGYMRDEILTLVDHKDGVLRLQLLYSRHLHYRGFNYTPVKIMMIVFAEIQNQHANRLDDELSTYLQEIDMMREEYYMSEIKSSFISLFKPKVQSMLDIDSVTIKSYKHIRFF